MWDNFQRILICFHTFGGRRPLWALEPRIWSKLYRIPAGFLNLGIYGTYDTKSMITKKNAFKII